MIQFSDASRRFCITIPTTVRPRPARPAGGPLDPAYARRRPSARPLADRHRLGRRARAARRRGLARRPHPPARAARPQRSAGRTSVFRLARDGWLAAQTRGRAEPLSAHRRRRAPRFADAYRRIYAPPVDDWDGTWEVIVDPPGAAAPRGASSCATSCAGRASATLAAGVFVRPLARPARSTVDAVGGRDRCGCAPPIAGRVGGPPLASEVHGAVGPRRRSHATTAASSRCSARVIDRFRMRAIDDCDPAQCFVGAHVADPRVPPRAAARSAPAGGAAAARLAGQRRVRADAATSTA